jgi:hypothetical protein
VGLAEATQLVNLRRLALKPCPGADPGPDGYTSLPRLTQLLGLGLCLDKYSEAALAGLAQMSCLQVSERAPAAVARATRRRLLSGVRRARQQLSRRASLAP